MARQLASDPYFHDAFISYSRKDRPFAALLQRSLNRYTPPSGLPVARRRFDVFRDEEDFTGTEYFQAVGRHLDGSRKLIVICSPNARASAFVDDEIRSFVRRHTAADVIPLLIAGRPEVAGSSDDKELAFPAALCELLKLPLAADYREFDPATSRLKSARYRTAWFKLLADLCNCSRAEIEMRERRRKFRQRLQWGTAAAAISAALVVAGFVADKESRLARSNELANEALSTANSDPDRSTSLALEAIRERKTSLAVSALRVAQANMPELQSTVTPDAGPYGAMVFAPDRQRLVVADKEAGARVLDARTGKSLLELRTGGRPVAGVAFSPDGQRVALSDFGDTTTIYESVTGKRLASLRGKLHWLTLANGVQKALNLRDGAAWIIELQSSGSVHGIKDIALPELSQKDAAWAVSPDGLRLAVATEAAGGGHLAIVDLTSGKVVRQTGPFSASGVAWSPKGTYLVSKWLMGFAVFDTNSPARPFIHDTGNEISVEDVAFSADETLLATTDRSGFTTLWDLRQRTIAGRFSGPGARAYTPEFSPDGELLSVVFSNGQASLFWVRLMERDKEAIWYPLVTLDGTWGEIVAAHFSPSGKELFVRYAGGKLAAWSTERWLPQRRLPLRYEARYRAGHPQGLDDLALAPDGSVIGIRSGGRWRGWNTASGAEVSERPKDLVPLVKAVRTEADGRSLHIAGQQIDVKESATGRVLRLAHSDTVTSASFSPNGACVVSASGVTMASGGPPPEGNRVRVWDAESGSLLRDWHFDRPPDAAFFTGSERVVVLYRGETFIYSTPLCGSEAAVLQRAAARRAADSARATAEPATAQN